MRNKTKCLYLRNVRIILFLTLRRFSSIKKGIDLTKDTFTFTLRAEQRCVKILFRLM
jgi:hypothetical protein